VGKKKSYKESDKPALNKKGKKPLLPHKGGQEEAHGRASHSPTSFP